MKTTVEIPDRLLAKAKLIAARRRTTLKRLFVRGLEVVTADGFEKEPYAMPKEAEAFMEVNDLGMPVLRKKQGGVKVTNDHVNQLKEELGV